MKNFLLKHAKYILLAALLYMPLFGFLDRLPIRLWDESRLAVNAYEMYKNGNLIVTHFEGRPDLWNTKPPLMIWLQVLFFKINGLNVLSLRLPSAIAGLLTCISLLLFSLYYLKSFTFGFISILVLICTHGYIDYHVTRTGDYDSLLIFFLTLSSFSIFLFIHNHDLKFYYIFFISLAFGVLTKGIAGLFLLPAIGIYIIWEKQLINFLNIKHTYYGFLIFLTITLGYYLLRESLNNGYLESVWSNEMGGRFSKPLEGHNEGFWFYYNNLIDFQMSEMYLFIPCGIITGLLIKNQHLRKLTIFCVICSLSYFTIISVSRTKLQWYDAPLYPSLSVIVAVFIYTIFDFLRNFDYKELIKGNIIGLIFLYLLFIQPYTKIFNKTYLPKEYSWDVENYKISHFLKTAEKGYFNLENYYIVQEEYNTHLLFYIFMLKEKGTQVDIKKTNQIKSGDKLIVSQKWVEEEIETNFDFKKNVVSPGIISYEIL